MYGNYEYTIKGALEYQDGIMGGPEPTVIKREIVVYVRDCNWLIRTFNAASSLAPATVWECGSTNGPEIFGRSYRLNGPIGGGGTIQRFAIPFGYSDPMMTYIWLGLASHCYGGGTNVLPPRLFDLHDGTGPFEEPFRALCQRFNSDPPLPTNIVYFHNGYVQFKGPDGKSMSSFLPPPFDKGYTNASMHITGVTNIGRLRLPLGFIYEENKPNQGETLYTKQLLTVPIKRIVVQVTEVLDLCQISSFVPALAEVSGISDFRFERSKTGGSHGITYASHKGQWLAEGDAKKVWNERKTNRQTENQTPQKGGSLLSIVILLGAAVIPMIILVIHSRRRSSKMEGSNGKKQ